MTTLERNILDSYLQTAQWVTCDSTDKVKGFTKLAKQIALEDCKKFIEAVRKEFTNEESEKLLSIEGNDLTSLVGHDLHLTRNRHGAGFWDKEIVYNEIAENAGERLTKLAQDLGTSEAYIYRGWLNFQ